MCAYSVYIWVSYVAMCLHNFFTIILLKLKNTNGFVVREIMYYAMEKSLQNSQLQKTLPPYLHPLQASNTGVLSMCVYVSVYMCLYAMTQYTHTSNISICSYVHNRVVTII